MRSIAECGITLDVLHSWRVSGAAKSLVKGATFIGAAQQLYAIRGRWEKEMSIFVAERSESASRRHLA